MRHRQHALAELDYSDGKKERPAGKTSPVGIGQAIQSYWQVEMGQVGGTPQVYLFDISDRHEQLSP